MKTLALPCLVVMLFIFQVSAQAEKTARAKPTPTPSISVTFNYCAPGDADCDGANRVRNDADRPYVNGSEGVSVAFQTLSGSNDITIGFSGTRTVVYDLTEMSAAGDPTPSWVSQPVAVQPNFNVLGGYNAKLQCGSAPTCDINYVTGLNGGGFTVNRIDYRLQWHPTSVQPFINVPEDSSAVNVHYIKDATQEVFIVTPLPNMDSGRIIAGLQADGRHSSNAAGQYVMPFTMTIRLH